jgi:lipoprotein-releasing system ATP-binding protein
MHLKAENLIKSFELGRDVKIQALRDVSLEISQGEIVSIIGPSGAGKSTLLHLLGLMDRPTAGKIFFDGLDSNTFNDAAFSGIRNEKIGFLFQFHYLLPDFSVLENILIPVWQKRAEKKDFALKLLDRLGLSNRIEHMPSELSGGEQQRVALARALINNPELIMADEPTGNLDRETGEKVEEIMFAESRKNNITIILVTHNTELAGKATRVLKMRDGRILE